jgi:hypothetical protein
MYRHAFLTLAILCACDVERTAPPPPAEPNACDVELQADYDAAVAENAELQAALEQAHLLLAASPGPVSGPRAEVDHWYRYLPKSMKIGEFVEQIQGSCPLDGLGIHTATGNSYYDPVKGEPVYAMGLTWSVVVTIDDIKCVWGRMQKQNNVIACHGLNTCPDTMTCNAVTKVCE